MKNKNIAKKLITTFILLFILTIIVVFIVRRNKSNFVPRQEYDKTRFVDYKDLSNKDNILIKSKNERFKLDFDVNTTEFVIIDNFTNQEWNSNLEKINSQTQTETKDLYNIFYERQLEVPKEVKLSTESIKDNSYAIHKGDDYIEVLYRIGGKKKISYTDLPRKIEKEKFEELILRPLEELAKTDFTISMDLGFLKSIYMFLENDQTYFLKEITSQNAIDILYNLIFNKSLYTEEDYINDNEKFGFPTSDSIPYFEFVVRYELTNLGLDVTLINDSIVETEDYQIAYIDILPYFGANNVNDSGFTIIPDGQGIYIDHDNGNYSTPVYDKRIYGSDMSIGNKMLVKPETQETIKFPMYGYSKNGNGFINHINNGAEMTSIRSQFKTTQSEGSYTNKTHQAYYRYNIRERDSYNFKSTGSSQRVSMWTTDYNKEDFNTSYIFLEEANNYYDFVEKYQEILFSETTFSQNNELIHLTFLGGYVLDKNFLGIPYKSVETLTKFNEVKEVLDLIDNDNYSVSFKGWSNNGLKHTNYNKVSFNNKIGNKNDLKGIVNYFKSENINFSLEVDPITAYSNKNINEKKDVNYNILQKQIYYYDYDLATNLANTNTTRQYYLNKETVNKNYKNVKKFMDKYNLNNVVINSDGSLMSSNFKSKNSYFRNEIIDDFSNNIELLENKNVIFRNPNLYAMLKSDIILDLSYKGTKHKMISYEIPFVQLVLNGNANYYGEALNVDTSKSLDWYLMKSIETGSKNQFLLSYEDTVNLINTEYSYLYSTKYTNWVNDINNLTNNLVDLGIYNNKILNHEVLNKEGTVIKVTYSNNSVFELDYRNNTYKTLSGGN